MSSNTVEKKKSAFDSLPIAVQMLLGIALLLVIVIVGFAVFFAVDILLLDADPIGKLVSLIAGSIKG